MSLNRSHAKFKVEAKKQMIQCPNSEVTLKFKTEDLEHLVYLANNRNISVPISAGGKNFQAGLKTHILVGPFDSKTRKRLQYKAYFLFEKMAI
jgi:hypothetical protein